MKKYLSYGLLGLEVDHPGIDQNTLEQSSDSMHFMLKVKILIGIWNFRNIVYKCTLIPSCLNNSYLLRCDMRNIVFLMLSEHTIHIKFCNILRHKNAEK